MASKSVVQTIIDNWNEKLRIKEVEVRVIKETISDLVKADSTRKAKEKKAENPGHPSPKKAILAKPFEVK